MKQADNNEVDLLLRSLAKTWEGKTLLSGSLSADERGAFADHLDADELNSYAEGVAPAPARARYTAHLADCDRCRGIVIGLTQASGATAHYEAAVEQRGAGFWQKLSALLSPAVLRYAVPVLALAGLIGISLFVFRQRSSHEFMAENLPPVTTSTPSDQFKPAEPAAGYLEPTTPEIPKTPSDTHTALNQEEQKTQAEKNPAQVPGSDSEFGAARSLKDLKSTGKESGEAQSQPADAAETKAATPAAPSTSILSQADKSAGIAKEQPAKRDDRDEAKRNQYLFKNTPSDEHGPNRSAAPRAAGAVNSPRVSEPTNERAGGETNQKLETREAGTVTTVAGRHFKHEGNTWIDTAYEPSRGTINVNRGSEQYRALVADEPGLRTIANQLRGVVIVVWKNRVYRIQ